MGTRRRGLPGGRHPYAPPNGWRYVSAPQQVQHPALWRAAPADLSRRAGQRIGQSTRGTSVDLTKAVPPLPGSPGPRCESCSGNRKRGRCADVDDIPRKALLNGISHVHHSLPPTTTSTPSSSSPGSPTSDRAARSSLSNSADRYLKVHHQGPPEADVTEGSGGIWERLHYDWSDPNHVVLTTTDSNIWGGASGYTYTFTRQPNGTTDIDVVIVREGKNFKGRVLGCARDRRQGVLGKAFDNTSRLSKLAERKFPRTPNHAGRILHHRSVIGHRARPMVAPVSDCARLGRSERGVAHRYRAAVHPPRRRCVVGVGVSVCG